MDAAQSPRAREPVAPSPPAPAKPRPHPDPAPAPGHALEPSARPSDAERAAREPEPAEPTPAAGSKRPRPSLLPPFEPLSSSPALPLPRPLKRQNTGASKYPTPVPTSSTALFSSSPVQRQPTHVRLARHHLPAPAPRPPPLGPAAAVDDADRPRANHHHRAPLSAVPAVELPENGEPVAMGRSSNSSHFQLSANRLVSRVHLTARYLAAANPLQSNRLEILCTGWNGLNLHCQGRSWELFKGDSFTSETEGADVLVDVLDARVMLQWPKRGAALADAASDSSWDDSPPPPSRSLLLPSSPLRRDARIQSPESPTPGAHVAIMSSQRLQSLLPPDAQPSIDIYEDEEPDLPGPERLDDVAASMLTEPAASFSSDLSDADDDDARDPDEENDPIVHSFGPFGANIAGRLASITTRSPKVNRLAAPPPPPPRDDHASDSSAETLSSAASLLASPVKTRAAAPARPSVELDPSITNHVVNQLAFSRLSSTPLSTIMQNLPAEAKAAAGLTPRALRAAMEATPCVGIIPRQGKDAAGKPLESEYYYVPEHDGDGQRRAAVVDGLRKPSLRNCRKQHKQYYWKRPRTP